MKLLKTASLLNFLKLICPKLHCFLLLSNLLCVLQLYKTLHAFIFLQTLLSLIWIRIRIFKQPDQDSHSEKLLDPDPQKMNVNHTLDITNSTSHT